MHAFQGRTVDNVIAAMEASHPHLTTQKSFYVEISRATDRGVLVTDDASGLKEQLEHGTGERTSALEGIVDVDASVKKEIELRAGVTGREPDSAAGVNPAPAPEKSTAVHNPPEVLLATREKQMEMDFDL